MSAATGMPQWLKTTLLAAGLLIGAAFAAEAVLEIRRRRRPAAPPARPRTAEPRTAQLPTAEPRTAGPGREPDSGPRPGSGQRPGSGRQPAEKPRIVLADYDRLVVTRSQPDDTVYVLRPPGQDPAAILRAARLVLPEGPYGELADQLGVPASWPMQ